MADDRVIIKCKYCGGWTMFLKHYTGVGPLTHNGTHLLGWLDSHVVCRDDRHQHTLDTTGFSLHLEDEIGITLDPVKQNRFGGAEYA